MQHPSGWGYSHSCFSMNFRAASEPSKWTAFCARSFGNPAVTAACLRIKKSILYCSHPCNRIDKQHRKMFCRRLRHTDPTRFCQIQIRWVHVKRNPVRIPTIWTFLFLPYLSLNCLYKRLFVPQVTEISVPRSTFYQMLHKCSDRTAPILPH